MTSLKTFGSDPEFMLFLDNTPRSAIGVIQSIEKKFHKNGHEFYYDNVLAECAIKPGESKEKVIENFRDCLQIYTSLVKPYQLVAQASATFDDNQFGHPDSRKVGCAKDMCAYLMRLMDGPLKKIMEGNERSCGGHIHLGSEILASDGPEPILAVLLLDLFLAVPSLWLDKDPTSSKRRSLYGQAGRYRVKSYGIEYRTLGNFWLQSPEIVGLIYDLSMFVIDLVDSGKAWDFWDFDLERFLETDNLSDAWTCKLYDPVLLQQGINETNKDKVISHFNLMQSYLPLDLQKRLTKMIEASFPKNLMENWTL